MKKNSLKEVRVSFPMFSNLEINKTFRYYQNYVESGSEGYSFGDMRQEFSKMVNRRHSFMDVWSLVRYFRDNYHDL